MINRPFRTLVLAAACATSLTGAAAGRSAYDGSWSVLIMTSTGDCDRAFRAGVQISDGFIVSESSGGFNMQGRVSPNGSVRVSVSAGSQSAAGSGRLTRTTGSGLWRGRGNAGVCTGTWQAERRD
jgi:hypothetical protein